jgi:hypothetical protein
MFMRFAWFLMLFLVIGTSTLAFYWSKKAAEKRSELSSCTESFSTLENGFHEVIAFSVAGPGFKDGYVRDIDNDSVRIGTIFPLEEEKLVLRFKQDQCLDCIDSTLTVLNEFARVAGNEKVILLTTFHDLSSLRALRRSKHIPFKIYNCDPEIFQRPTDDLGSPYLFLMDHRLIAELPLSIPSTETWLSRYYLSTIRSALMKSYRLKYPITIERTASIQFDRTAFDLGNIEYGGTALAKFTFHNNGPRPLVVTSVVTGCGCTTATYPRQPVLSGDSSSVEVGYDTHRTGAFDRTIIVYTNGVQSPTTVEIKGYVKKNGS